MRTPPDRPRRLPQTTRRTRVLVIGAVVLLIVVIASLRGLASFWTDYLWFESVGFTSVFRGVLLTKILLAAVFVVIFFVLMMASLTVADRLSPVVIDPGETNELVVRYRDIAERRGARIRVVTSAVFALLAGVGANSQWNNWDLFRYRVNFGVSDLQFHRDVGFYMFELPFIRFLIGWGFEAVIVITIVTAVLHYLNGGIQPQASSNRVGAGVKVHISVLLGVLAVIRGVGYYYDRLGLVLSRSHVVNGATATSVHANAPADFLLMIIAGVSAVLFLANIRQRGWILPAVAVGLWALVGLLIGDAYPALYQALRVSPSEQTRESPYIQRNIDATRKAYGLDNVQVVSNYQYNPQLSASEVQGNSPQAQVNQQVLGNVRLLDPAVNLLNTFGKFQGLRSYYSFNQLDLDRYPLDLTGSGAKETATIASVRELNTSIPSGFVNQHLQYTHGYGAVMAPISESGVNSDGTPNFLLQNLPPQGPPSITPSPQGSQIYFGEGSQTTGYVIANSKTAELDYGTSSGAEVHNSYTGDGGVAAGSLLRRAAFALRFGDANFILSGQITSKSRVMYIRNVTARVQKAAPFLKLDSDPYSVILDGRVYWIVDAYTVSDNYPYSQNASLDSLPANSGLQSTFNYVRNSVKVVVSAFDGSMHFFVVDKSDPVLEVYQRVFPDLFTPLSQAERLIPGITAHFRYPENLFQVQANMYGRYHLSNANDFYSQAQAWQVSPDPGSGPLSSSSALATPVIGANGQVLNPTVAKLQPQYELLSPPDSPQQRVDFDLLTPFVPISATGSTQNLTAFMTASSDPGTYGQLHLYPLPPGEPVEGPGLISNAIKTNQEISEELTFYNQQGSQVELGEVAIIPIDNTLLYVQPVYVESSTNRIPNLDDVVVVYNGQAYHSKNASLDKALCAVTNQDGSQPFSSYCNTQAALGQSLVNPGPLSNQSGGSSTSSTTTPPTTLTPSPPTSVPPPPGGATVASLLASAAADLANGQAALRAGNLALYQSDYNAAQTAVAQAQKLSAAGPGGAPTSTTTTTAPPHG